MPNDFITPNMNLIVPIPTVAPGPEWAEDINSSLEVIDQHDHSFGNGVQINPAGININTDLPFNANNATLLRSTRYSPQNAVLIGAQDLDCLYCVGPELYFNDGNGNPVQLTKLGAVNVTSTGIQSGTATASFVAGVLVVNAAATTPANIQGASILIGNNIPNSNFVTLAAPNALASSYQLTLPTIPVGTSFMTLDNSGGMAATIPIAGGITSSMLDAQLQPVAPIVTVITGGSGSYVPTITTRGSPLYARIKAVGAGGGGGGGTDNTASASDGSAGSATTFGAYITANGGAGGTRGNSVTGGPGGNGGGTVTISVTGESYPGGTGSGAGAGVATDVFSAGGTGGGTSLSAGGGGGFASSNSSGSGFPGPTNTGAGGGGGGCGEGNPSAAGGGGQGGGYACIIIPNPVTTAYTVGAAGAGGSGAGNGSSGGSGADGVIVIEEYYQ